MELTLYQVDSFSERVFGGNPAAVCPLGEWLDVGVMQKIARENNLSETAFFVKEGEGYGLRWFTPSMEVDLCGHATLASAYIVFKFLEPAAEAVEFRTVSGVLAVAKEGDWLAMDFPSRPGEEREIPGLAEALKAAPKEVYLSRDIMAVFDSEAEIRKMAPDMAKLKALEEGMVAIVTAPGEEADFVARCFAPKAGIDEDPVTGSAYCTMVPYWSGRLGKRRMRALQVSDREGEVMCEDLGKRVKIAGKAALYLTGKIFV